MSGYPSVTLGVVEQALAILIASRRRESNASRGVKTQKIGSRSDLDIDIEGAGGEVAFCMIWNVFPATRIKDFSSSQNGSDDGDCLLQGFHIDVKTAKWGRLLAFEKKKRGVVDYFALMIGTFPTYEFKGFMAEAELLRPERIVRLRPDLPPTYVAEQSELMVRLPEKVLFPAISTGREPHC